jgi:hypothetical protein
VRTPVEQQEVEYLGGPLDGKRRSYPDLCACCDQPELVLEEIGSEVHAYQVRGERLVYCGVTRTSP